MQEGGVHAKKERGFCHFFHAFQKMKPAATTAIIPSMPLTSLGDNIWPAGLLVVIMASPSKSAAKHMTIIPTTILSIRMNSYFRQYFFIILCVDYTQQKCSRNYRRMGWLD